MTTLVGDGTKTALYYQMYATSLRNPIGGADSLLFPGQKLLGEQYERYYVAACTIKLKVWNPTTTDFLVTLVPELSYTDDYPSTGSEEAVWSLPRAKTTLLLRGSMNNSNSVRYMNYYMTTKKMFPDDDPAEEVQYQGSMSPSWTGLGSPATQYYFTIYVTTPDGSVIPNLAGPVFEVQATMHTRFTRVKSQGQPFN